MALPSIGAVNTDDLKSSAVSGILSQLFGNSGRKMERSESGVWNVVGSVIQQFFGLVGGALGLAQWSISSLLSWIQSGTQYIWNFDWNASNATLDQQIKAAEAGLAGIQGAALGNALGYLTCGIAPSAGIFVVNEALGYYLLKEVGEEALQEAAGYMASIIQANLYLTAQKLFISSYQSNRALYNLIVNTAGNSLASIIPGNLTWQQYRQQRQAGGLVSFADFVETSLETLPAPEQAFWENFFEEASDACWEALYVIAGSIDNWLAQQRVAREVILGPERRIEITPNRLIEDEKIVLVGPEALLKAEVVSTLSHYQLLDNKDIGQFVGQGAEDYALANRMGLRIKIVMYPYPKPPFERRTVIKPMRMTVNIPDVPRSKLDYELIRTACGNDVGYTWGPFLAQGKLNNGRTMQTWGSSAAEAERQLMKFLSLSSAELVKLTVIEEKDVGELLTNPSVKKRPQQVFPGYVTVWNRDELLSTVNAGRSAVRGNFKDKKARMPIWPASKPLGFDQAIQEILVRGVTGIS